MLNIKRLIFVCVVFICFFSSKNLYSQVNKLDENNQRTGVWVKKYDNGNIRYKGEFKNGKEIGVFKFFSMVSSDYPIVKKTYSNDSLFVEFYTINGVKESEGYMIDKKRTGIWKYFYPTGKVMSEENYVNGKLEGEQLVYYPDGQVTEFAVYKNGLLDGTLSKYASNGVLIEEVNYLEGNAHGVAKYFELNGDLKETGTYKHGKRFGKWEYYLDGELATEEDLKKKKKFDKSTDIQLEEK
jgi:antitoxin component YwqK of YwqJK toxin-antitoxin module